LARRKREIKSQIRAAFDNGPKRRRKARDRKGGREKEKVAKVADRGSRVLSVEKMKNRIGKRGEGKQEKSS